MSRFFISLYHLLSRSRPLMYSFLVIIIALFAYASSKLTLEEDPLKFFPENAEANNSAELFSRIRAKDKIIVLFSKVDSSILSTNILIGGANLFDSLLCSYGAGNLVRGTYLRYDGSQGEELTNYVFNNLPIFLDENDYKRIDSLITPDYVRESLSKGMASLISPAGSIISPYFGRDPLGIATPLLASLKNLQTGVNLNIVDNYLFSSDNSTLLYIVDPLASSNDTKTNGKLLDLFDSLSISVEQIYPGLEIQYMGAPFATVYNTRQIKTDTLLTVSIAILLITVVLWLAFRRFSDILLLLSPAIFGALFSLALISLFKDSISAIAVGAGATVMGIALSYSIHVISHMKHVSSVEQMLKELSYPLTVGSFTTIGALVALLFTNSPLLQDFGLFSSVALIGTTLFSLIFLPHMLKAGGAHGEKENFVMKFVDKISLYGYENSKWLLIVITILFVLGIFFSPRVQFESDMMAINYEPDNLKKAQECYISKFGSNESRVLLLSSASNTESAINDYRQCDSILDLMRREGIEIKKSSVASLVIPHSIQQERIDRWNQYWQEKSSVVKHLISSESKKIGFSDEAFQAFYDLIDKKYEVFDYQSHKTDFPKLLSEWCELSDSSSVFITQLFVDEEVKSNVYNKISSETQSVIVDRAYFAGLWATSVKDDFYFILTLSSLLVFLTLLVSYGRIELALLAFLPMFVSWIIILGMMAICGIKFNIVNILLSTFIFGIGDDFSIFVLDGLQGEYAKRNTILSSHKNAIFFSTFTVIVGMGVLIFAKHPALRSIATISTLGMMAVWFVALTVQPVLFRHFITYPVRRSLPPYTVSGILLMFITFSIFVIGCILAAVYISIAAIIPVPVKYKKKVFHKMLSALSMLPVRISPTVKIFKENPYNEDFKKPAIIIANHQSFIDILMMLSLNPNIIMMTNRWVWNSPVFGHIVRYAGFIYYQDGIENHIEQVKKMTENGYSVVIFPEGTRSKDLKIHRFRKGAFYIAEKLSLDILPVIMYGNGHLVSKQQPFYVKHGIAGYRILPRISCNLTSGTGKDYSTLCKETCAYMRKEYDKLRKRFDTPQNKYFYYSVIHNYIYKGPVLEWYMRIKIKMENNYSYFHDLIPLNARLTDIGCGYGPLCFMLGLMSEDRHILGIDYDKEKIDIARNCYLAGDRIRFEYADALIYDYPECDVFVMNDILHYLSVEDQYRLLEKTVCRLSKEGFIIVRDGDNLSKNSHLVTKLSEWFSINLLGFNKASHPLCFINILIMENWAKRLGCSLEFVRNDKLTSNTIYLLRKLPDGQV